MDDPRVGDICTWMGDAEWEIVELGAAHSVLRKARVGKNAQSLHTQEYPTRLLYDNSAPWQLIRRRDSLAGTDDIWFPFPLGVADAS